MVTIDDASGRDLDVLIAERLLAWRLDHAQLAADGTPFGLHEVPRYSANAAQARGVTMFLEMRHPGVSWHYVSQSPATVVVKAPSGREYSASDASEAVALCRAVLKALDGEGPGTDPREARGITGPRALAVMGDLLGRRLPSTDPATFLAQVLQLQHAEGPGKKAAAIVIAKWLCSLPGTAPIIGEQALADDADIARTCVLALAGLAAAGDQARHAIAAATAHADVAVARAAKDALTDLDRRADAP